MGTWVRFDGGWGRVASGQVGGGTVIWTGTPRSSPPVPVTATRQCLVPVLSPSAKTSFPGRGPLRCAPWSFPPGGGKVPRPVAPASTVPVPWRGAAQDLGVRDPTAATLPASTRKQDRRPDGNNGNGSPRTSPKKQNTERVCEDALPPLPGLLSVCWRGQTPISETRGSGEWLIRRLRLARHPRTAQ